MPTARKPYPSDSNTGGTFTATGVETQNLKINSARSYYGFNTVAVWGTWAGRTVKIQAQLATNPETQLNPPTPATGNWIDVPDMSLTTNGLLQPQVKADFLRLHKSGATSTPSLKYQAR